MALAISIIRQNIDQYRSRVLLWSFYVTTPIGIVVGAWWSGILEGRSAAIMEGLFDAMAAGTFLHIAVVDTLIEEFRSTQQPRVRPRAGRLEEPPAPPTALGLVV